MDNSDDPGSSTYNGVGNLSEKKDDRLYGTRYFIIKSLNHHNIQLSIEKGIWATQVMNESILEEAFHNSGKVILIFSVNMSGFFQGYAQMMSAVGWRRDNVWTGASGGSNPWGRTFKVKWLRLNNLPFQKTLHLKNPLNDYKPVKISRDCQELSQEIGEALCGLIDGRVDVDENLKRDELPRRPFMESPVCLPDEYVQTAPPSHTGWARIPMLHPSVLHQHVMQAEASNFQGYRNTLFPMDDRHLFAEKGFSADSVSEDDFLEMTYEEYLQAHGRSSKPTHDPVAGPSYTSSDYDDYRYSHYQGVNDHLQNEAYHPSPK